MDALSQAFYAILLFWLNILMPFVAMLIVIIIKCIQTNYCSFFKNIVVNKQQKIKTLAIWTAIHITNILFGYLIGSSGVDNRYNPMEPMPFYQYAFFLIWIAVFIYLFSDAKTTYQIHKIPMHVITIVFGAVVTGLDLYQMFSPNRLPDEYAFAQYAMLIGYTACGLWTIFGKQPRAVSPQQE